MSEPPRRRVAIPTEPEEAAARRGFIRAAAILGVIVGLPAGILGVPACLNYFFDEATVTPGGSYDDSSYVISIAPASNIESGGDGDEPRAISILLAVEARETLTFDSSGAELELANGDRIPAAPPEGGPALRLRAGEQVTVVFTFVLAEGQPAAARVFHLREPDVRFELTESEE